MRQVYFSADGKLLAVACEDRRHTVMIFRWEAGLLRCQARLGVKKALSLCFSQNASELVAAGYKHFKVRRPQERNVLVNIDCTLVSQFIVKDQARDSGVYTDEYREPGYRDLRGHN